MLYSIIFSYKTVISKAESSEHFWILNLLLQRIPSYHIILGGLVIVGRLQCINH